MNLCVAYTYTYILKSVPIWTKAAASEKSERIAMMSVDSNDFNWAQHTHRHTYIHHKMHKTSMCWREGDDSVVVNDVCFSTFYAHLLARLSHRINVGVWDNTMCKNNIVIGQTLEFCVYNTFDNNKNILSFTFSLSVNRKRITLWTHGAKVYVYIPFAVIFIVVDHR